PRLSGDPGHRWTSLARIGQPRKLVTHSARNGFVYTMDRYNGQILGAKPVLSGSSCCWFQAERVMVRSVRLHGRAGSVDRPSLRPTRALASHAQAAWRRG